VGDGADAERITSDVFERALRYRDSYKRSKDEPIAWMMGIARGCIADAYQQRVRRLDTDELGDDVVEAAGKPIGMKPNAVDVALHRARARLRGLLKAAERPSTPVEPEVRRRSSAGRRQAARALAELDSQTTGNENGRGVPAVPVSEPTCRGLAVSPRHRRGVSPRSMARYCRRAAGGRE
jgi:sigma-70-like protein